MPPKPKPFTLRLHGNQWRVRFTYSGTRHDRPIGADKTTPRANAEVQARQFVIDYKKKIDTARRLNHSRNPITRYHRRLEARSDSHALNCYAFQARLIAYFGADRDLQTISPDDIEAWRDWLLHETPRRDRRHGPRARGLAPKTVKEHLDWLAAVYNHAGLPNPCRGVERPRPTHAESVDRLQYFTPAEVRAMIATCRAWQPVFYNALIFFIYTGARVEEVQNLRAEHLNHATRTVPLTGKGDKTRPVNLSGPLEPAWRALTDQIATAPRRDGYIFQRSKTWARVNVARLTKNTFGQAIPLHPDGRPRPARHGHPHMFRHTFASLALQYFEPRWAITDLAKFLGHSDISTTYRIYSHWIAPTPPSGPNFVP